MKGDKFLITGDFFGRDEIHNLTNNFLGLNFKESEFIKTLKDIDLNHFIHGMTEEIFLGDLFKEAQYED